MSKKLELKNQVTIDTMTVSLSIRALFYTSIKLVLSTKHAKKNTSVHTKLCIFTMNTNLTETTFV